MKRRAWRIWFAKRSVGVGLKSEGSPGAGGDFGGWRRRGRSSYIGLRTNWRRERVSLSGQWCSGQLACCSGGASA